MSDSKEKQKVYYKLNREKIIAYQKKRYQEKKEKISKYNKKYFKDVRTPKIKEEENKKKEIPKVPKKVDSIIVNFD